LHSLPLKKTHSIRELVAVLGEAGIRVDIDIELCHTLDSIYIPSKYPLTSCLPDCEPDTGLCETCIGAAEYLLGIARSMTQKK